MASQNNEVYISSLAAELVGKARRILGEGAFGNGMLLRPPQNYRTGHRYAGINMVNLYLTAKISGWSDMRFVSEQQLQGVGRLKHGVAGVGVIRPLQENGPSGILRYQENTVYNIAETDIVPVSASTMKDYRFFDALPYALGIRTVPGDTQRSRYVPSRDVIMLGRRGEQGEISDAAYYGELLQEIFKATGASGREHREDHLKYGLSEFREFLFCSMVSDVFGFGNTILEGNTPDSSGIRWHVAFINKEPDLILSAAADAARIAGGIMDIAAGVQPKELSWVAPVDFSRISTPLKSMDSPVDLRSEIPGDMALRILPTVCDGPGNEAIAERVGEILERMPPLLSGEHDSDLCMATMKIVDGNGDTAYLLELDKKHGTAFGWVIPDGNIFAARGKMYSAEELAAVDTVDVRFTPRVLGDLVAELEENAMIDMGYIPQGYGNWETGSVDKNGMCEGLSPSY